MTYYHVVLGFDLFCFSAILALCIGAALKQDDDHDF